MQKDQALYVYGILIIIAGIFLVIFQNATLDWIKYSVIVCLIPSALFAYIAAVKRNKHHEQFAYHEMHAIALMVYSVIVLFFCPTFSRFIFFTAALMLFYTFSEITFSIWLMNLKRKINMSILFSRLVIAMFVGIGPVIILARTNVKTEVKLLSVGILFIAIGVNVFLYKPIMKVLKLPDVPA